MSSRHTRSLFGVMLAVVFALSAVIVAPASAKLSKHQKAHIRHQLMRQIKKNPKLIRSKSFIKKASLVNFTLPVTVALHGGASATNPNGATLDLGPSLGQRAINLSGTLPAEIVFHDSFDGGALGNVDVKILPPPGSNTTYADAGLNTNSIPLLWNSNVNSSSHPFTTDGCYGFYNAAATGVNSAPSEPWLDGQPTIGTGVPMSNGDNYPIQPGVDDPTALTLHSSAAVDPTDPDYLNNVGGDQTPFPGPATAPGGFGPIPNVADTVLRTAPLSLVVAKPGTPVSQSGGDGAPQGSQDITIGQSGGQANLFGSIPGKPGTGIDVTVSLATQINSIIRQVDNPLTPPLVIGDNWSAPALNCRQAVTGTVQNYIPGLHLTGGLTISPAILPGGGLRIAKATLGSADADHIALAACLAPDDTFAENVSLGAAPFGLTVPFIPIIPSAYNTLPTTPCNDGSISTLASQAGVATLNPADANDGYSTTSGDGSQVSVAGDIKDVAITADILIGDTP